MATITAGTGQSRTLRQNSAQKSHSANIEPTERSMPPTMTTSAMPSTTKPISPACRPVSARPPTDRKPGIERLSSDGDDQEDDDRDRGFGPALGQDFAEQMIRPVAVSQTKKGVLHRLPGETEEIWWSAAISGERPRHGTAARRSSGDGYFLRSLRFQQAVSLPAFSLVIGISVVYIDPLTEPGLTPDETSHLIMPAICSACVGTS